MKKKFEWWDNAVIYLLMALAFVYTGQFLGMLFTQVPLMFMAGVNAAREGLDLQEAINQIPGVLTIGAQYLAFIGIWIVVLVTFLVPWYRPMYKAISTKVKGNNIKLLLFGLLIGGGTNALCAFAAYMNGDIHLYYDSFHPVSFVLIFLCVFVQSSAEELVCRCFLMQMLLRRHENPWIGIIGNAVLFSLLHVFNDGITPLALLSIVVIGIQYSLMVYYMDSIWCPFAAHASWNFMQNIVLGLPNSGMVSPYSVMKLEASTARDSWAYNVGFGVESTIFAVAIQVVICILIVIWGESKGKKNTNIWLIKVPVQKQAPVQLEAPSREA